MGSVEGKFSGEGLNVSWGNIPGNISVEILRGETSSDFLEGVIFCWGIISHGGMCGRMSREIIVVVCPYAYARLSLVTVRLHVKQRMVFPSPFYPSCCLSNACIVTKHKKPVPTFLYHIKYHLS